MPRKKKSNIIDLQTRIERKKEQVKMAEEMAIKEIMAEIHELADELHFLLEMIGAETLVINRLEETTTLYKGAQDDGNEEDEDD